MTKKEFIESFDFDNSEWAQEWIEQNGKINTIKKLYDYLMSNFDDPFEYLFEHIENVLIKENYDVALKDFVKSNPWLSGSN
jgi:hypothetical protein